LSKEKAFAAQMPGVIVHQRVAILWGPIPSMELARRAQEVVRQVPGLVQIRNELQIDQSDQPLTKSFALPSPERSASGESALSGPFQAPAALVGRPTEHGPAPAQGLPWRPGRPTLAPALAAPIPGRQEAAAERTGSTI